MNKPVNQKILEAYIIAAHETNRRIDELPPYAERKYTLIDHFIEQVEAISRLIGTDYLTTELLIRGTNNRGLQKASYEAGMKQIESIVLGIGEPAK